jgi:hypothetical protein
MIITSEVISEKLTKLTIDFRDEEIELVGVTEVVGNENTARAYAHFFEQDLRRNNAELFPVSEIEIPEMDGETI